MDKFPNLCVPFVNSNGSGADRLIYGHVKAFTDLDIAYGKLKLTGPNARDYQDSDAFELATTQHLARLQKIADVMDELECLIEQISKQKPGA